MPKGNPSPSLIVALREAGIKPPIDDAKLRELIRRTLGAEPPSDRTSDDLAYAVLGLARVGMLRGDDHPAQVARKRRAERVRQKATTQDS